MATLLCPTCENPFDTETSTAMPFCSSRCKQIDLGRWINEEHSMPVDRGDDYVEREQDE